MCWHIQQQQQQQREKQQQQQQQCDEQSCPCKKHFKLYAVKSTATATTIMVTLCALPRPHAFDQRTICRVEIGGGEEGEGERKLGNKQIK